MHQRWATFAQLLQEVVVALQHRCPQSFYQSLPHVCQRRSLRSLRSLGDPQLSIRQEFLDLTIAIVTTGSCQQMPLQIIVLRCGREAPLVACFVVCEGGCCSKANNICCCCRMMCCVKATVLVGGVLLLLLLLASAAVTVAVGLPLGIWSWEAGGWKLEAGGSRLEAEAGG